MNDEYDRDRRDRNTGGLGYAGGDAGGLPPPSLGADTTGLGGIDPEAPLIPPGGGYRQPPPEGFPAQGYPPQAYPGYPPPAAYYSPTPPGGYPTPPGGYPADPRFAPPPGQLWLAPQTPPGGYPADPRFGSGQMPPPQMLQQEPEDPEEKRKKEDEERRSKGLLARATPFVESTIGLRSAARRVGRFSPQGMSKLLIFFWSLLAVGTLYAWWHGSWEGAIDSPLNLAAAVAQIAGMFCEFLILTQVLLMARVPLLENAFGTEFLAKAHTILGFSIMTFLLEHIVGATYLNMRQPGISQATGLQGVFLGLRDVLIATVGTGLMYMITLLSIRKIRERLPYEVWRYLHWFVYIGIMLEFVHQLTLGIHFLNSKPTLIFWLIMHATVFVLVAWYRVGRIAVRNARHRLRVDRVVEEGPGMVSIYMKGYRLEKLNGIAGQFMRFRFLDAEGWWQSHPFSLSAAPSSQYLRITVRALGDWTTKDVTRLHQGTFVFFSGPYGGLTPTRRLKRKVVLLGAGIGITPMRSLLAGTPAKSGDIHLLYRAKSENELVFREELDELAKQKGAKVHYLLGPRENFAGNDPFGAKSLEHYVPNIDQADCYLCGPEGMLTSAINGLRDAGVPRNQIHTERFNF